MNILVIGKFYTEGFALHIAETLVAMGPAVQRFEPSFRYSRIEGRLGHRVNQVRGTFHTVTDGIPSGRAWCIGALWKVAEQGPLDVAIICSDFLLPAEVAELKQRTGTLVTLWFPDTMTTLGRAYRMNAPYDALFFKDPYGDILPPSGSIQAL